MRNQNNARNSAHLDIEHDLSGHKLHLTLLSDFYGMLFIKIYGRLDPQLLLVLLQNQGNDQPSTAKILPSFDQGNRTVYMILSELHDLSFLLFGE